MTFQINQSLCTRCGLCIKDCPPRTIHQDKETGEVTINQENCMSCSHCGMICPSGAVTVDGRPLPPIPDPKDLTDYEKMDLLLRTKRSVRHYRSAPILKEDLDEILFTGSISATASNSQQVAPVVLRGGEVAAATARIAGELLKVITFAKNPLVRFLLKRTSLSRYTEKNLIERYTRALHLTLEGKADPLFFHAPTVVILTYPKKGKRFGRTDSALAGAHMMLSAHARGLGSCMIGFAEIALKRKALRKELGIPADRRIGLVFTLGYTDQKYHRYPVRKPWELV